MYDDETEESSPRAVTAPLILLAGADEDAEEEAHIVRGID